MHSYLFVKTRRFGPVCGVPTKILVKLLFNPQSLFSDAADLGLSWISLLSDPDSYSSTGSVSELVSFMLRRLKRL